MPYPLSKRLRHSLEILGGFILFVPLRFLPLHWSSGLLAGLLGFIGPKTGKSRVVRRNLALVLPQLTPEEQKAIEKQAWRHIAHFIVEFINLPRIYKQRAQRIEIVNPDIARAAWNQGKGLIIIGAHLGAWELMVIAAHMLGMEGIIVYRPPNNRLLNNWMIRRRIAWTGYNQISKYGTGVRSMIAILRGKKMIGLLADQRLNEGITANFFGKPTKTNHIPIKLVRRYGTPLLYATARRLARGRFRVQFDNGTLVPHTEDEAEDVRLGVEKMNERLEYQIRADVGNWLWTHNRWNL